MSEIVRLKIRSQWAELILREHDERGNVQDIALLKVPINADVAIVSELGEPAPRVHHVVAEDGIAVKSSAG